MGWSSSTQDGGRYSESQLSIEEFEIISADDRHKRLSHEIESSEIMEPVTKCRAPGQNLIVLGKAYGFDYWKEVAEVAEFCTRRGMVCHFAIDGADIQQKSTIKDVIQTICTNGHIIIVEPSSADFASQMTAAALLKAVSTSSKHLESYLGKKPVYVRLDRKGLSKGQLAILVKNNYVPILVDEGSDFIYNTPSRFVLPYFTRRLDTLSEGEHIVSLAECSGIPPYIAIQ